MELRTFNFLKKQYVKELLIISWIHNAVIFERAFNEILFITRRKFKS